MSYFLATRRSARATRGIPPPSAPLAEVRPRKRTKLRSEQSSCWLFKLPDDLWPTVRDLAGAEEAVRFALACKSSLALVQQPAFWANYEQPVFRFSNEQHRRILRFLAKCPIQRLVLRQPYYQDRERWSDYQGYSLKTVTVETLVLEGEWYSDRLWQESKALDEFGCIHNLVARGTINICLSLQGSQHTQTLRTLVISGQRVLDENLRNLQELQQLQNLALHDCRVITDHGLKHLRSMPKLQKLYLASCPQITGSGLQDLPITGLALRDLVGATNVLQLLPSLTKLQELDLLDFRPLAPAAVRSLDKGLTKLKLALDPGASDELLDELSGWPGLQALCLSRCPALTPRGLAKLQRCPALQELRLGQANPFANLEALHACRSLRTLKLWRCGPLTTGVLNRKTPTGLAGCAGLQRLVLGSYNITSATLSEIKQCQALQKLEFSWCYFGGDVAELKHCRALRTIKMSECQIPPAEMLQRLRQARPGLQVDTQSFPANELEDLWDNSFFF